MSRIDLTPEQRLALATAADRPRTAAEALMLARLADEQGMPGSAAAWREVAASGIATSAVPRNERKPMPTAPQVSGNMRSALQAVLIAVPILIVALFVVGACSASAVSTPVAPASTPVAAAAPTPLPVPAVAPAAPKTHAVTRVIDGDTFEIEGGQRVRLLGIDACEIATEGGKVAKLMAQGWLEGQRVALVTDGSRDRDRYGRILARAEIGGTDVGAMLVPDVTVEVYQGRNDASASYLAELRAVDGDPRNCTAPEPVATEDDSPFQVESDDDDRDRESRFCRKRWYC